MKTKIYILKDRVEMLYNDIMTGITDGAIIRQIMPWLEKRADFRDLELYKIGELDRQTGAIKPYEAPIQVSWDSYKFPETKAETKDIAKEAING